MKNLNNIKLIYAISILTFLSVLINTSCRRDGDAYTIPYDKPFPPEILYINTIINNCSIPYNVSFDDSVKYKIGDEVYFWDFGDGKTSTQEKPNHVFTATGLYTVVLKITNAIGTSIKSISLDLRSESVPVISGFDYYVQENNYFAPATVDFTNTSEHATNYFWIFGDGTFSTQKNPIHTYYTHGNYNVKLYAICNGDSVLSAANIFVKAPPTVIEISRIIVNVPPDTSDSYKLYCKLYRNGSFHGQTDWPTWGSYDITWVWNNDDWYSSDNRIKNPTYNEDIEIDIFDHHIIGPDDYLYYFSFNTSFLKNNYYPTVLNWYDGYYSATIEITYY